MMGWDWFLNQCFIGRKIESLEGNFSHLRRIPTQAALGVPVEVLPVTEKATLFYWFIKFIAYIIFNSK